MFACLDAVLAGCETLDLFKGPPGGVCFAAAAGAELDFRRAPGFVVGLGAADLVMGGFEGDLLETETPFGAGSFAAAAAALDDAGAGAGGFTTVFEEGFGAVGAAAISFLAPAPFAVFDGFGAVGAVGAAAISFLAPVPVSFFFLTKLPPPRIGYGIFTVPPPPPPPLTPSSPKGLLAVGTLGPGAFV